MPEAAAEAPRPVPESGSGVHCAGSSRGYVHMRIAAAQRRFVLTVGLSRAGPELRAGDPDGDPHPRQPRPRARPVHESGSGVHSAGSSRSYVHMHAAAAQRRFVHMGSAVVRRPEPCAGDPDGGRHPRQPRPRAPRPVHESGSGVHSAGSSRGYVYMHTAAAQRRFVPIGGVVRTSRRLVRTRGVACANRRLVLIRRACRTHPPHTRNGRPPKGAAARNSPALLSDPYPRTPSPSSPHPTRTPCVQP